MKLLNTSMSKYEDPTGNNNFIFTEEIMHSLLHLKIIYTQGRIMS